MSSLVGYPSFRTSWRYIVCPFSDNTGDSLSTRCVVCHRGEAGYELLSSAVTASSLLVSFLHLHPPRPSRSEVYNIYSETSEEGPSK
jgi:hypothetical protein